MTNEQGLVERLREDARCLARMVKQAAFAGPETGVRVGKPDLLMGSLTEAADALEAQSVQIAELQAGMVRAWNAFGGGICDDADDLEWLPRAADGDLAEQIEEQTAQLATAEAQIAELKRALDTARHDAMEGLEWSARLVEGYATLDFIFDDGTLFDEKHLRILCEEMAARIRASAKEQGLTSDQQWVNAEAVAAALKAWFHPMIPPDDESYAASMQAALNAALSASPLSQGGQDGA